jgi:hypothetical protein
MRYVDEVAGAVCSDGGPYAYEFVERDGVLEIRARLVSEYLASPDAAPLVTVYVRGTLVADVVATEAGALVAPLCLRALAARAPGARFRLSDSVRETTWTAPRVPRHCTRKIATKRAPHLRALCRMGAEELRALCVGGPCERDYFFGIFEALAAASCAATRTDDEFTATYPVLGCAPLVGRVRRTDGEVHVTGSLFACSYVALRRRSFACSNVHDFIRKRGWRADADKLYSAIATAMDACSGFVLVYPRLDAIAPCTFDGSEAPVAADCVRVARTLRLDVHLPSGAYMFGYNSLSSRKVMLGLGLTLGSCSGENAWRVRGLLAINVVEALRLSAWRIGKSAVAFTETTRRGTDEGQAHAVCGVLVAKRDAHRRVISARVMLRNSFNSDRFAMGHVLDALRAEVVPGAKLTLEWVALGQRDPDKTPNARKDRAARWQRRADAPLWQTQRGEGSCMMHALMCALWFAQQLRLEPLTDAARIREAMKPRCPPVYGAIVARAFADLLARSGDVDHRNLGYSWEVSALEDTFASAMALFVVGDRDARLVLHAIVTCDGDVTLRFSSIHGRARGSRAAIERILERADAGLRHAAAMRRAPVVARVYNANVEPPVWDEIDGALRARGFEGGARAFLRGPEKKPAVGGGKG